MELNVEPEFECQICMDLLVEPITTICGHTYCKICLIRYLRTKLNCPMCRKPILQSKESLAKNVMLENIIKSKYKNKYEERLKIDKMSYEEESSEDDSKRNNMPAIHLNQVFIWPKVKRRISITDMKFESTLSASSINDRLLAIIPFEIGENNLNGLNGEKNICCIVEILSIEKHENKINLEVIGRRRFLLTEFRNAVIEENLPHLFVCSGEILKDLEIESEELRDEVKSKLDQIEQIHTRILQHAPYSFLNRIEHLYGKSPKASGGSNLLSPTSVSNLEPLSFYYLNLIKDETKKQFYFTSNIIQRVDWIYSQYSEADKYVNNQSLPLNFYDLSLSGTPKNQLKFTILLFVFILLLGFAVKYKFIRL